MKLLLFLAVLMVPALSAPGQETPSEVKEFSRPTIVAVALPVAPSHYREVYEDEDFLFAFRDYGYASDSPGFFVYGKKQNRWMKIVELSTERATLGRSLNPGDVSVAPQVSWNYAHLKNRAYVKLPLPTNGSLIFPNQIAYDASARLYTFGFNWCWDTEVAKTKFRVQKKDLEMAFRAASGD
jgi:hypothetical protein